MKYHSYLSKVLIIFVCALVCACDNSGNGQAQNTEEAQSIEGKTVLAIFAHPDDEITVAPLLAKYANEGATVKLAIVTDGRYGGSEPGDELAATRALEALCSTASLDIDDPILMEFVDGEVSENINQVKAAIAALFAEIEPDVVITWGPEGGYGHKDHRLVSTLVTDVFQAGGSGDTSWPEAVYFGAVPESVADTYVPISGFGQGLQMLWGFTQAEYLQYIISVSDEDIAAASTAAACHASQWNAAALVDIDAFLEAFEGVIYLREAIQVGENRTSIF